jgi:hypothetical protein
MLQKAFAFERVAHIIERGALTKGSEYEREVALQASVSDASQYYDVEFGPPVFDEPASQVAEGSSLNRRDHSEIPLSPTGMLPTDSSQDLGQVFEMLLTRSDLIVFQAYSGYSHYSTALRPE